MVQGFYKVKCIDFPTQQGVFTHLSYDYPQVSILSVTCSAVHCVPPLLVSDGMNSSPLLPLERHQGSCTAKAVNNVYLTMSI